VCTNFYADYSIRPGISPKCFQHALEITDLSANAQHLVAKTLECGIAIDEASAFWMSCHLDDVVSEWDAESIGSNDSISTDLLRFREIDQNVIGKFQSMVRHAKWNKGDAPGVSADSESIGSDDSISDDLLRFVL